MNAPTATHTRPDTWSTRCFASVGAPDFSVSVVGESDFAILALLWLDLW